MGEFAENPVLYMQSPANRSSPSKNQRFSGDDNLIERIQHLLPTTHAATIAWSGERSIHEMLTMTYVDLREHLRQLSASRHEVIPPVLDGRTNAVRACAPSTLTPDADPDPWVECEDIMKEDLLEWFADFVQLQAHMPVTREETPTVAREELQSVLLPSSQVGVRAQAPWHELPPCHPSEIMNFARRR